MSGGNLSPRQKMINMMYLVLTALLALNVSAEILEAFASIRASLGDSAASFSEKNSETKSAIIAKVNEELEQKNKKNEYIKGLAEEVTAKANELKAIINEDVAKLEDLGKKDPVTGEIEMKSETEKNYQHWMGGGNKESANGGRGDGAAYKLKEALGAYVAWANGFIAKYDSAKVSGITFRPLAVDPKDDERIPNSSSNKNKPWEYFTFHSKPLIADLAMLEKFKIDVAQVEYDLLSFLKARLGAVTFKIDSLIAVDAPISQVVAAGMEFETKLFVAMSSSEIKPEFSGSGRLTVNPDGNSATMKLMAQGGFAKDQVEKDQSYFALIKVPRTDGTMQELKVDGKFKVRKPEVVITSASVQNLYWNCGNALNVDVPALGDLYNPKFAASSATVLPSTSDKKKVTIIPTGRECILGVSSLTNGQTIKIDDIKYKVIKPPKPEIQLLVNGKEYNGASPIPSKSNCVVRVKADSDFLSALPKDARYMISNVDLLSQRSLGAPTKVAAYSGGGVDGTKGIPVALGNSLKGDTPGTKIYFKIDKVYRINFQNNKIEENFADRDLFVGAVIK